MSANQINNLERTIFGYVYLSDQGGQTSYKYLQDKPSINGQTLEGNLTLEQIGIAIANAEKAGLIKSSSEPNSITILPDGTPVINQITYDKLLITEDNMQIVERKTMGELPSLGKSKTLYLTTEDQRLFMWSESELRYVPIKYEMEPIEIIDGGTAFDGRND